MPNWVVEHQEGTEWVPKARTNFDDKDQFTVIAKNPMYRILEDGIDVTNRYRSMNNIDADVESVTEPVMNPSQYKNLNDRDKHLLQHKVELLLENKKKRAEILTELNVSEATYDLIRADMKQSSNVNHTKSNTPKPSTSKSNNKPYRGSLLGRR